MAKLVTYIFIASSLVLWYLLLFGGRGVEATNGHGGQLEGRDFHHHGGSHHIRRKYTVIKRFNLKKNPTKRQRNSALKKRQNVLNIKENPFAFLPGMTT